MMRPKNVTKCICARVYGYIAEKVQERHRDDGDDDDDILACFFVRWMEVYVQNSDDGH